MDKTPPTTPEHVQASANMYLRNNPHRADPTTAVPALHAALNQEAHAIATAIECGFITDESIGRLRSAIAFNDLYTLNPPQASASDATTPTREEPA
jgi:hypothetical protein